jgi:hypothetical protein
MGLKSYCRYKTKLHASCDNHYSDVDLAKIKFETPYWEAWFYENDEGGAPKMRNNNFGKYDLATSEWLSDPDCLKNSPHKNTCPPTPVEPSLGRMGPKNSQGWFFRRKAEPEYRFLLESVGESPLDAYEVQFELE